MTEHQEQSALFAWAKYNEGRWPELRLLFAIANGAGVRHQVNQRGQRYSVEGAKLKAEGVKSGVPDICLPVARNGYHGLFIELKTAGGRVRPEQLEWGDALGDEGYAWMLCYGWMAARNEIKEYLGIREDA